MPNMPRRVREAGRMDRYGDQRFTLTDVLTFELMREARIDRRIASAFAYYDRSVAAGFALEP
jgi:hypothetical protein